MKLVKDGRPSRWGVQIVNKYGACSLPRKNDASFSSCLLLCLYI